METPLRASSKRKGEPKPPVPGGRLGASQVYSRRIACLLSICPWKRDHCGNHGADPNSGPRQKFRQGLKMSSFAGGKELQRRH